MILINYIYIYKKLTLLYLPHIKNKVQLSLFDLNLKKHKTAYDQFDFMS